MFLVQILYRKMANNHPLLDEICFTIIHFQMKMWSKIKKEHTSLHWQIWDYRHVSFVTSIQQVYRWPVVHIIKENHGGKLKKSSIRYG